MLLDEMIDTHRRGRAAFLRNGPTRQPDLGCHIAFIRAQGILDALLVG